MQDAGNVTTLANYIELLQQSNLLAGLHKFAMDVARKRNSIPKFQVFNNALLNAFRRTSYSAVREDPILWGRQVESAVGAYLLNVAEKEDMQVYYWREKDAEVDFVLQRGDSHPKRAMIIGSEGIDLQTFFRMDLNLLFD